MLSFFCAWITDRIEIEGENKALVVYGLYWFGASMI